MKKCIIYIFLILNFFVVLNLPLKEIYGFEAGAIVTYDDIKSSNKLNLYGGLIKTELDKDKLKVGTIKNDQGTLSFKLFGIFPIRKVKVTMLNDEEVYVGGIPIGLAINSSGAIVVSEKELDCDSDNLASKKLKVGDILTEVDDKKIENLDNLSDIIQNVKEDEVEIKYLRKNKELKTLVKVVDDKEENKKKLGLYVKDDISGVGTLTYVNTKSLKFGALGHGITDTEGENIIPISNGKIYNCNILGINKGKRNNPGELRCLFIQNKNSKGNIEKNNKFGIYGTITNTEGLVDKNLTVKVGGRLGVKTGKAYIVSSISGIREEYEIEIIKANYQKKSSDKSLVLRVKDKRLLNLTGGIVQGMSGSPIIQDGKLIGAVTHVFLSDPTKGYGVYCDWMM